MKFPLKNRSVNIAGLKKWLFVMILLLSQPGFPQKLDNRLKSSEIYISAYKSDTLAATFDKVVGWRGKDGMTTVMKNGKWGLVNKDGETVYPFISDCAIVFIDGFSSIEINGKFGFINEKLEMFVKPQYDEVFNIHEGLVSVSNKKKWGVIDSLGAVIIPVKYDFIFEFYEGMAQVELKGKHGFFNLKGELVIPIVYDKASPYFNNGKAKVELGTRTFFIDKKGNET